MTLRKSKPTGQSITIEDAREKMHKLAECSAKQRELVAQEDLEIAAIRAKFAAEISGLNTLIESYEGELQLFAESNKETLFVEKKSVDFNTGTIGFRTGTPALALLPGYKWAAVLDLLKKKKLTNYIKKTEAVMKDQLIIDRVKLAKKLNDIGVEVKQTEKFFIELKTDAVTA